MSKRSAVESPTRTSPSYSLNPILQTALGSLDVQLDEELARYRRQRAGLPAPPPRGLNRYPIRKPLDVMLPRASRGTAAGERPVAPTPVANPNPTYGHATQSTSSLPVTQWDSLKPAVAVVTEPGMTPTSAPGAATVSQGAIATSPPPPASAASSQLVLATEAAKFRQMAATQTQDTPPLTNLTSPYAEPEDYLESTEQLLKSLAEEDGEVGAAPLSNSERGLLSNLLSPLGIGSMLLLLASSASLGYVLINPSSLQHFNLSRLLPSQNSSTTAVSPLPVPPANPMKGPDNPHLGQLPNSPNLASKEFVDLNLGTLSTINTPVTPAPVLPIPSPAIAPGSPSPTAATPTQPPTTAKANAGGLASSFNINSRATVPGVAQPAPSTSRPAISRPATSRPVPAPRASAPVPVLPPLATRPAPVEQPIVPVTPSQPIAVPASPIPAPSVAANSASTTDPYYYVVVPYSNDRQLEQVQQVVPDAYLRNFEQQGAQIQLGAFNDAASAENLQQQLQQQGVNAEVYRP